MSPASSAVSIPNARPAHLETRARPTAMYLVEPRLLDLVYGPSARARLEACLTFPVQPQTRAGHAELDHRQRQQIEVIISSWGMPRLTPEFLSLYPSLRIVFYGAGSVRDFVTPAAWRRGLRVVTAAAANSIPVAEYAFAHTVLGLKRAWFHASATRAARRFTRSGSAPAGTYGSTVGLLALGHVGRLMARRLQSLDVKVIGYDPYVDPEDARSLGVQLVPLDELFARSDVVSCHLPFLPETAGILRGPLFASMPPNAVFINTARGEVVAETEMLDVLRQRPDILAVIDVTDPEPPKTDSPLYDLPNVFLTPHIAGSLGPECRRLGLSIAEDVERYVRNEPIANEVREADIEHQA